MSFFEKNRELLLFLTGGEEPIFVSPTFDPMETAKEKFREGFGEKFEESDFKDMEILIEENTRARKEIDNKGEKIRLMRKRT